MAKFERAIFAGPSLYRIDCGIFPGELFLAPAKAGDILKLARGPEIPHQIVLIDGVFYQDLSVWHKELVYALLKGIVCIGAASMGALRASELWRYGMIGIGEIFERYRNGEEDDSLVAMSFEEVTFRPLNEAKIGHEQKCKDAVAAIEFARGYTGEVNTSLTPDDFGEYLQAILNRLYGP